MGLSVKKVSSRRRGPIRDASARKGTKPALSKEYQAVFENTGKAMVIVEEDATISLANVEFEQLSGYTKEEIEGKKSWTEFVARDDRKRVREYHRLRRTDPMLAPRSFEFRLLDRHEKVKNVVLTIGTIPGTSKSMASLLDVTDRRQAEKQVHRDKKALEERVESQTTELIRANKALQAEVANLKRKVKKLEESEELYRNLVEKVDFGINLIDADHNIVMANTEQSKRFNKPVSELIGKKCFREFEKRDAVCPHCPGVQAIATGQPAEVKTKSMRDDQSHSQVRIQTFPIFGQDGTASGFIEVVEDISERKLMEKKLEEERNLLRTMIDNIPDYIYVKDTESRYLLANNAHARFRGATKPEAVVGKTVFELFPQELAAQYYADDQKVIRSGQPMLNREECSVDHEGKSIWNQTSKVPLRDSSGKVVGLIGIARDITERKQMEAELRKSEERYRNLVETMKVGLTSIDEKGLLTYANEQFCRMLGYSMDEVIGRPTVDFYYDEEARKAQEKVFAKRNKGMRDPTPYEVTWRTKDGRKVQTILTPTPHFDADGHYTGSAVIQTDITEHKRAEQELRKSQEELQTFMDALPVAVSWADDLQGNIQYINRKHHELFGYTLEDIPTVDAWRRQADQDPAQRERFARWGEELIEAHKQGRSLPPQERTVTCKDGSIRYVMVEGTLVSNHNLRIYNDITERKLMEEQIQQAEERYRTLVETMKVGLTSIDEKGLLTYANEQFCRMLGYSMDEVIGRPTVDFYYDEEARKAQEKVFAKRNKGMRDPTPYEVAWRAKDGRKVHTILSPTPHFDADGHYTGSAAIQTDITERKRAEQELRKSQEELQAFMDASPVAVTWSDLQGNIQYINRKHHELFGYTLEDIPTVDAWRRQADQDPAQRERFARWGEELIEAHKQGRSLPPQERTVTCKDGSIRYVMVGGALVSNHNLRIYNDITERKLMEEQLQRYAAELERSNEEVKNFAYIVSHDLRVPLVNLKGYTSELRSALEVIVPNMDTVLPHLTEEKRSAVAMALHEDVPEALEFITTSVSRMDSFINAVLQLSRLGRRELKSESIDMKALVQGVLETLAHHIQERDIQVTVGSLPEVVADRTSMEQIMGNVLGNAVKYLDPERPGQIEVTAETNNGEQLFLIHDNGRGIAEEDMHKVFAPFRRAGKQDTPGEGMGLAYVQTLVRRHGGRIWCESELEKGTTMTFTISQHRAEGGDYVKDR